MPWPWGARTLNDGTKRLNRHMRRTRAKRSHGAALLFETIEPRVLLNAAPFAAINTHQQQQTQPLLQDTNGTQLFATLNGPGHVQAIQTSGGPELLVTGTNANSSLVLTVKGGTGHFVLNTIDIAGQMNSVTGAGVDLHGQFTANGPVQLVSLGDVQNSTFTAAGPITSLNLGKVQDSTISVKGSIGDLEVNSWISTGAPNQLNAVSIGHLGSLGDFDASLALSGPTGDHGTPTLGVANIGGTVADGYWYIVGDTGLVVAGQVAANWTGDFTKSVKFDVQSQRGSSGNFDGTLATADLKSFTVSGNLVHASVLLGVDLGPNGKLGDSSNHYTTGTLELLFVRGSFTDSRIWVGVVPGQGGYDTGGDSFFGNPANDKVQFFSVGGSLDSTSKVEAGAFTLPVFVNGKTISPATTDPHFVTHTINLLPSVSAALLRNTGVNQLTGAAVAGLTNDPTITGSVAVAPGGVVTLEVAVDGGGVVNVSQALNGNGTFLLDPKLLTGVAAGALADGKHTVRVIAVDQVGSSESDVTFTLKTTPPAIPTLALAPTDHSAAAPTQTTASTVTLTGQSDPGVKVGLTLANGTVLSTFSDTKGHFQFANVALALGANVFTAQATDNAGNTSKFTLTVQRNAQNSAQPDSVLRWNQITLQAIQAAADDPVVASRVLALESLAVFDAINSINGTQSYFVHLAAPADTSTDAAVAAAAHEVLSGLYPQERAALDALFAQSLNAIPNGQGKIDGVALGTQVADDILQLRASDGSQISVGDPGSDTAGQWRPTGPDFGLAISPQFANVTPFALNSPDQFLSTIAPPPTLDSAAYAAAVQEVDALGSASSTQRTADQTQIAQFWAGGLGSVTIGGQWNQIAEQVAQHAGDSEGEDARLFAELNAGLADTGIAAWNAKYNFNLWSPVTAIQNADSTVNPALTADPKFTPLVTTPQAPEYVETQAAFSAAAADILASFFGDNTAFTATSTAPTAGTRSFTSLSQAAQEAGRSGIFAGTDFQFSNLAGQALGKNVGDFVLKSFDIAKDTQAPRILVDAPNGASGVSTATNIVTNKNVTITGTVLDNLVGVQSLALKIDGGPVTAVSFDQNGRFSIPLNFALDGSADGQHTITLTATNAAGTVSSPLVIDVTLATQGPQLAQLAVTGPASGQIGNGSALNGVVTTEAGTQLAGLTYSFDNKGTPIPVAFDSSGNVNQTLDLSKLGVGTHTITITATDTAGNVTTATRTVTLAQLIPLTVTAVDPSAGAANVGVTFQPLVTFSRPIDVKTLTNNDFFVTDASGATLTTKIVPWADGMHAWIIPGKGGDSDAWPGASTLTLHIVGSAIKGLDGSPLDAAGTGAAGGSTFTETFSTVNTAPVAGTSISGTVIDPGPSFAVNSADNFTIGPNGQQIPRFPIAGVKVYVLGHEDKAVFTDANGNFTLTNVPAGDVKLVIDGRTATNDPTGVKFPNLTVDLNVQPGVKNTVGGTEGTIASQVANVNNPFIFLPRVESSTFTTLSTTAPTVLKASADTSPDNLTEAQRNLFSVTVQPNTMLDASGTPLPSGTPIGVSIIPKATIRDLLPPGLTQTSLVFTVQVPSDTFFTAPMSVTLPNTFNLPPGTKTNLLTFDYTTGLVSVAGTMTVSADGKTVTTNPGVGITKSGWFAATPEGSETTNNTPDSPVQKACGFFSTVFTRSVGLSILKDGLKCGKEFVPAEGKKLLGVGQAGVALVQDGIAAKRVISGIIADRKAGASVATIAKEFGVGLALTTGSALLDIADGFKSLGATAGEVPNRIVQCAAGGADIVNTAIQEAAQKGCISSATALNVGTANAAVKAAADATNVVIGTGSTADVLKGLASSFQFVQNAITNPSVHSPTSAQAPLKGAALSSAASTGDPLLDALLQFQSAYDAVLSDPNVLPACQNLVASVGNFPSADQLQSLFDVGYRAIVGDPPNAPFAFTLANGDVIRGTTDASGAVSAFLPPNTAYQYTVVDTRYDRVGFASGTTGPSGSPTTLSTPDYQDFADLPSTAGDGVPDAVYAVLGRNPSNPGTIVAGVSNLQAINDGLQSTSSLPNTTGIVGSISLPQGSAQAVKILAEPSGGTQQLAFIAAGTGGLAIVDASNPVSPVLLSQTALPGNATDVDVWQSLQTEVAAVATGTSLQILNVEDGTSTEIVHSIAVNATRVVVDNGMAFVNDGGNIDAFDLASGQKVQSLSVTQSNVIGLTHDGNTFYALDDSGKLYTLSLATNNTLATLGSVQVPNVGFDGKLAASNGFVFIGNTSLSGIGFNVVNATNPSAPSLVPGLNIFNQTLARGTDAQAIALDGAGLGVAVGTNAVNNSSSIDILDETDPTNVNPFITRFTLPAQPFGVAFGNGMALVADGAGGLQIVNTESFDVKGAAPALSITSGPGAGLDPTTLANTTFNFTEGQTVSFGLSVTDKLPIVKTELLINGIVAATNTNGPTYSLTANLPSLDQLADAAGAGTGTAPNQVVLKLRATDAEGRTSVLGPINGVLAADTTAPTLVSQNVANGGTIAASFPQLIFNFSKPIDPSTVAPSTFSLIGPDGNPVAASSLQLLNGGTTVVATYGSLASGKFQFQIDAAEVKDFAGNALGATPLVTHLTVGTQFTDTFINANGGDWNNAANWSAGHVPTAADSVLLQVSAGNTVTISSGTLNVASLTEQGGGSFVLSGGASLTVAGAVKIADTLGVSDSTLTLNSGATIANLQQTGGTINNSGTLSLTGTSTLFDSNVTSGAVLGAGTVVNQGTLQIGARNSANAFQIDNSQVLENQGTLNWVGKINLGQSGAIKNDAGATFNAISGTINSKAGGTAQVNNLGTMNISPNVFLSNFVASVQAATVNAAFNSSGTINVDNGFINSIHGRQPAQDSLSLTGATTISGTISSTSNSVVGFGGPTTIAATASITNIAVGIGSSTGEMSCKVFGSINTGSNNFTVANANQLDTTPITSVEFAAGGSLACQGTVTVSGQVGQIVAHKLPLGAPLAELLVDTGARVSGNALAVSGLYQGPINFTTAGGILNAPFRGTVVGTTANDRIGTLNGGVNINSNVIVNTFAGGVVGGTGTITVTGPCTIPSNLGRFSGFVGTGTMIFQGNLTIGGNFGVDGGGVVELQGHTIWNAGNIDLNFTGAATAGTLRNDAGAEFDDTIDSKLPSSAFATDSAGFMLDHGRFGTAFGGAVVLVDGSNTTALFDNRGLFRKTGGSGTTTIDDGFKNSGTIEADQGTIAFNGAFANTGQIVLGANGTLTGAKVDPTLNNLALQITSGPTPQANPIQLVEGSNVSFGLAISDVAAATVSNTELVAIGPNGSTVLTTNPGAATSLSGTLPLIANNGGSTQLTLRLMTTDSRGVTRFTDILVQLTP